MKLIHSLNNFFLADVDDSETVPDISDYIWFYGFYIFIISLTAYTFISTI